jgi:hypothetical protein
LTKFAVNRRSERSIDVDRCSGTWQHRIAACRLQLGCMTVEDDLMLLPKI